MTRFIGEEKYHHGRGIWLPDQYTGAVTLTWQEDVYHEMLRLVLRIRIFLWETGPRSSVGIHEHLAEVQISGIVCQTGSLA